MEEKRRKGEHTEHGADDDGDAGPHVVGHEDEHEEVADADLQAVEQGLYHVVLVAHRVPGNATIYKFLTKN